MKPWDGIIPTEEQEAYRAAGFGRPTGIGRRPALLIIDVQYRTVGTEPRPFWEAIKEFPDLLRRGRLGGGAAISRACSRSSATTAGPCSIPMCRRRRRSINGRLSDKVPAIMGVAARGYDFVAEVAPREDDVLLPKKHPSAFFGTPLASYLIDLGADTLVVTGCTTSGCVRGTVVDAFAYNFRVLVPHDCGLRPQRRVACGQPVRHEREIRRRHEHRRSDRAPERPVAERTVGTQLRA